MNGLTPHQKGMDMKYQPWKMLGNNTTVGCNSPVCYKKSTHRQLCKRKRNGSLNKNNSNTSIRNPKVKPLARMLHSDYNMLSIDNVLKQYTSEMMQYAKL